MDPASNADAVSQEQHFDRTHGPLECFPDKVAFDNTVGDNPLYVLLTCGMGGGRDVYLRTLRADLQQRGADHRLTTTDGEIYGLVVGHGGPTHLAIRKYVTTGFFPVPGFLLIGPLTPPTGATVELREAETDYRLAWLAGLSDTGSVGLSPDGKWLTVPSIALDTGGSALADPAAIRLYTMGSWLEQYNLIGSTMPVR
jgi:hypothetical protein